MKVLRYIVIGLVFFLTIFGQAQVSVNVNIGSPPPWGPAGYNQVRYYYLPDVESYYDVQSSMFIYYGAGGWVHRTYLPSRYKNYDLYGGYKVVMKDYHGNAPYEHFKEHKVKYAKGYHGNYQRTINEKPHHYKEGKGDHFKNREHGNDKKMKEGNGGEKGKKK